MSTHWRQQAACRDKEPEMFFPEGGTQYIKAVEVCEGCPVTAECLAFALANEMPTSRFGIWGGMSAEDRHVEFDGKPRKNKCKHGHELTDDNVVIVGNSRRCKICNKDNLKPVLPPSPRTHCRNGHEKNAENQVVRGGRKECLPCAQKRHREYLERQRGLGATG